MSEHKVLVILFFILKLIKTIYTCDNVCLTKTCLIEATNLLNSMDESVSPCDDFYQFSCGKWIQTKQIPEHKPIVNMITDLRDDLDYRIKNLLMEIDIRTESREFIKSIKNYLDSCLNTTRLEELGDKPLRSLLNELGGWPLVSASDWKVVKWIDVYLKLRKLGLIPKVLFSLSVLPDRQNSTRRILTIDQATFGMGNRDNALREFIDPIVRAYKNLISNAGFALGARPKTFNFTVNEIYYFEFYLANSSLPKEELRNQTKYTKVTIKELNKLAPHINWLKIIKNEISVNITEEEEIALIDIQYIKSLNEILRKYSNRFIVNYLIWMAVQSRMKSLNEKLFHLKEEFDFVVYGTKSRAHRWKICVKDTRKYMNAAVSYLYIKNMFGSNIKEESMKMFKNIINEFRNGLETNKWMANETRDEAIKKINEMRLMIAYPEELLNETKLNEYYENLQINSSDYFGNNLRLEKFSNDLEFNKLRESVEPLDWREITTVAEINAQYNREKNLVKMLAGILNGVFFNKERPNYLNYGAIGHVFGHEIIHGFDDGGRQYDSNGNLRNWWDNSTDLLFNEKKKCFIDEYNNYTIKESGQNLNGVNTQGENIADNGGIFYAYHAYINFVAQNGPELILPGLNYTAEQLFWISFAHKSCTKTTDEYLKLQVLTDPHSPSKPRINLVASNSVEFSEAYNCTLGSTMNPINKCSIF